MGIPIISDVLSFAGSAIQIFFQSAPKPLLLIFFLFSLMFFGSFIQSFILEDKYECDTERQLYDTSFYNACLSHQGSAWAEKHNLTASIVLELELMNLSDLENQSVQEQIKQIEDYNRFYDITPLGQANRYFSAATNFWRNIQIWNQNKSIGNLVDTIVNPEKFVCIRLNNCLTPEMASSLSLSSVCTVDDVPEWDVYENVTKLKISNPNFKNVDEPTAANDIFKVTCSEFETEVQPVWTFFGFEFLNWRLWLLLLTFSIFTTFAYKWYRQTGVV